jgi:hypothetical protein
MNYKLIRSVLRFLGMSLVVGTAVAFAYPTDTKPLATAAKLKNPTTKTTNRMQQRPPAAKPAGGGQEEFAKPAGSVGPAGAKVNSTLKQKGSVSGGNNINTTGAGNGKIKQNTVNKAGYQLGGSHGDDTPTENRSATGGAGGAGAKSTGKATDSSSPLLAHPASGSIYKPNGRKSTAPAKSTTPPKP